MGWSCLLVVIGSPGLPFLRPNSIPQTERERERDACIMIVIQAVKL